ncbi:MAG TPA: alpha-galactosidase [Bacteroidales bacterium]|nr:alpha-galactosidase [Bacteroidales bacterium]
MPILINYTGAQEVISLKTCNNVLVLRIEKNKDVAMVYYGENLSDSEEYSSIPEMYNQSGDYTGMLDAAYTPSGTRNLAEPAISVTHADGNNSLDLKYVSHNFMKTSEDISTLTVDLKDPVYNFTVTLYYKAYFNEDVIEQWSVIKNREKGNVVLHKFASANLYIKSKSYWLKQFHGDWAREMQPELSKLTHGIKTLDSKLGTRTDLFQPPEFIISLDKPATENEGDVLYGALEWSGNFKFDLEVDPLDNLRIIAGINNFASDYTLKADENFTTPPFLTVFSSHGKGEPSRKLHEWARKYKLVDGEGTRLTLLNNWESTYFDFNEDKLAELIKDTKKLGVDLFLLDDGWFGNKYPRNNDHAGLGDWQENKQKLPDGISWLVKEANKNGVKFGIWLEPEMVNPKSSLYEKHPEWIIKQPQRPEYYFRNQLVLDLSNPDVQNFVYNTVDGILTKNPGLAYIKWDCNSVIYNAYSDYLENQSHLYVDYVKGLYTVLERLRKKYPDLPIMLCSGGGGRVDYGALQYFTEYWPSDNTDPLERIFIQWEYSYFYPAISSSNHVTNWGKQPLKFRTDVAMMGKLGFDIVVDKLNEKDLKFCQNAVKNYDSVKDIIWHGDQYRLSNPFTNDVAAVMYLNKEKSSGVIFNYLVNNRYGAGSKLPIKLTGLNPAKKYRIREINLYPGTKSSLVMNKSYSGDFLMKVGYNPDVLAWRSSVVLKIEEVEN